MDFNPDRQLVVGTECGKWGLGCLLVRAEFKYRSCLRLYMMTCAANYSKSYILYVRMVEIQLRWAGSEETSHATIAD
jgi:hypothetical protein